MFKKWFSSFSRKRSGSELSSSYDVKVMICSPYRHLVIPQMESNDPLFGFNSYLYSCWLCLESDFSVRNWISGNTLRLPFANFQFGLVYAEILRTSLQRLTKRSKYEFRTLIACNSHVRKRFVLQGGLTFCCRFFLALELGVALFFVRNLQRSGWIGAFRSFWTFRTVGSDDHQTH